MTGSRRLAVTAGVLAAAGGVALTLGPAVGAGPVATIGSIALIALVGAAALWLAVGQLLGAGETSVRMPEPESRLGYRVPGQAFAATLDEVSLAGRRQQATDGDPPRERLRATLHDLAVGTLARTDGWSPSTAADRLADGTWTDDGTAAALFAGEDRPPVPRLAYLPVGDVDLPVARRARHAVTALADRAGVGEPDPDARLDRRNDSASGPYWPRGEFPQRRSTGLTWLVTAGVLAVSVGGLWFGQPGVVLTATLGVALLGVAAAQSPSPTVSLSRSLSTDAPAAGDRVTVTVTVRNTGDTTLPDIRLVDGVPPGLAVVEGSPRFTTALRPGNAATFSYTVAAVEGRHTFEPGLVVVGDGIGATETATTVEVAGGPTELDCGFELRDGRTDPPRPQVTMMSGQRVGDASGAGVEFDTQREYRPGDPPSRINWNHRARTGELATVEFREPRLSRVAVLVDTRPPAYVAAERDGVPAPRHGAVAAFTVASRLLADGVPVGFGTVPAENSWTPPGAGPDQRRRLGACFADDDAVPWSPPAESPAIADVVSDLTARLAPDTQVVFVSPCCDDGAVEIARTLDVEGHSVTLLSPDCTDPSTVEGAYGRLTRSRRLATLREHGIPVQDWPPAEGSEGVGLDVRH